ncbi:MAG: hypothetical protein HQL69_18490 [Magnetococcales bacterium]|nr:hypothetical protein [Magnetococcales bacterium]
MTFLVVRTIKGREYIYEQHSVREGERVRSITRYIGPADPVHRTRKSIVRALGDTHAVREGVSLILKDPAPTIDLSEAIIVQPEPKPIETPGQKSKRNGIITARISFNWIKIKRTSFKKDIEDVLRMLRSCNVTTTHSFPDIVLKFGKLGHYKGRFQGREAYFVSIPFFCRGKREKFRHHYRIALAKAMLDTLAKENPEVYEELAYRFDRHYKTAQDLITGYLVSMDLSRVVEMSKLLTIRWFNTINEIKGYDRKEKKRWKLKPEKIGLFHYGKQPESWREEFSMLYAESRKKGIEKVLTEKIRIYRNAQNAVNLEIKRKLSWKEKPFKKRREKRLNKLLCRELATKEMVKRVVSIRDAFDWRSPTRSS